MAKHPKHHSICRTVLGRSFPEVDKAIDAPVKILGPAHRKLFHSIPTSFLVGVFTAGTLMGVGLQVLFISQ